MKLIFFYFCLHTFQDYTMQPPTQELVVRDLHDNTWTFRHIYRGENNFFFAGKYSVPENRGFLFFFFSGVGGIFFCHFLGENSLGKKSPVFNDVRHCWPKRMMRQIAMYHTVNSTFA